MFILSNCYFLKINQSNHIGLLITHLQAFYAAVRSYANNNCIILFYNLSLLGMRIGHTGNFFFKKCHIFAFLTF